MALWGANVHFWGASESGSRPGRCRDPVTERPVTPGGSPLGAALSSARV